MWSVISKSIQEKCPTMLICVIIILKTITVDNGCEFSYFEGMKNSILKLEKK